MKLQKAFVALGLLSFLAVAAYVRAQTEQAVWPGTALNPLGLSAEQQNQIQGLVLKFQNESLTLRTSLRTKGAELRSLIRNPNRDPSEVDSKRKDISDLQAEMQDKWREACDAVRSILTDEQKTGFDRLVLGSGWGRGPCGLGLGASFPGIFSQGRIVDRGSGRGRGFGRNQRAFYGMGRGPCGMGLGRMGSSPQIGRRSR